ncbi:MAG: DUF3524 domain-containing protein [Spirochaetales bacterium]|uniref:tRNA-queuosine alpha-mannosyltransferase n=1 Tax=Candidatus Thalassospirochaeta sargassi TaxID=3119039 RepID=A0AAJ1MLK9_9SPIO|nr:DUF3524 domain-containing protein [Spirochaetales bacterium]
MKRLKILFIEPFYGGSHRDFADGLIKHSFHDITLVTLPARYWKWRMRGAALHFSQIIENPSEYDLLFTSDLMSLSDLKMLWGTDCPPTVVYFHENQLSYPLPDGEKMDYQFGFTDITTALAADKLLFNSYFHLNSFLDNMPGFIKKMPEYKPLWVVDKIRVKSSVLYPGCNFPAGKLNFSKDSKSNKPPLILWNHRWEFDKCPDVFFKTLEIADTELKSVGFDTPFNIALLGESFQAMPKAFIKAKERWGDRILQYGYCDSKDDYLNWLKRSDITISTAIQENFGISVVEAIRYGSRPLLPDRLSYPELIPEAFTDSVIYSDYNELTEKLIIILKQLHECGNIAGLEESTGLSDSFTHYSWQEQAPEYDELFRMISC